MSDREPHESRVGIFWLYNSKLITDTSPLSEAEPDGNILGHATGHIDYWVSLQERGALPIEVGYDEPPRGRVGYNVKKKALFMLADQCIIDDAGTVQRIIAALQLPENTESMPDFQYRCAKCLRRIRRRVE